MGRHKKGWKMFLLFILIAIFFFSDAIPSSQVTSSFVLSASTSHPVQGTGLVRAENASQSNIKDPLEDTVRTDPINHFKKYKGGYDIRNKHYWSSTAFTGVYGYAIGLMWLVIGVVYGGFSLVRRHGELKERPPCYKQCYIKHTFLATLIAILAIVATGLVLCGTARYYSRSRTILRIIISTEDDASSAIRNTTQTMDMISQNLGTGYIVGRYSYVSSFLKSESNNLKGKADSIERQTQRLRRSIGKGLSIVLIVTLVAVSLNLILVIALSVSGVLRFKRTTTVLIALCWILTILCWSLFGAYFFLENFSKDTCTAISDFQQNPKNSSLSSILPCNKLSSAGSVLRRVSVNIYDLVNKANANISTLRNTTYPSLVYVCNPFSGPPDYLYQPENCPYNSIKIGDIPQALKLLTCSENSNVSCKQGQFISSKEFYTIQVVTSSIQSLIDAYPVMKGLVECRLVKDSFALILAKECRPWKGDARMTWIAALGLSVVMAMLVLVWVTTAHHQHKYHHEQVVWSLRQLKFWKKEEGENSS